MPKTINHEDPNLVTHTERVQTACWWGCGGDRVFKQRTFTDRLTPMRRLPNGRLATKEDLEAELKAQGAEWAARIKAMHPKCQEAAIDELLTNADQMNARLDRLQEIESALIEHSHEPAVQQVIAALGFQVQDQTAPV